MKSINACPPNPRVRHGEGSSTEENQRVRNSITGRTPTWLTNVAFAEARERIPGRNV